MNTTPRTTVEAINSAWRQGRLEVLPDLFDEHMVIVDGDFHILADTQAACIASFATFLDTATVLRYEEANHQIADFGTAAVVTYDFSIGYAAGGQEHSEAGTDLYVLARDGGRWRAVWRQMQWRAA